MRRVRDRRGARLAFVVGLALPLPAAAQLAPGPGPRCGIDVGFEPLPVREAITRQPYAYHAVVLVSTAQGRAWTTAFEGNPTGNAASWGWLVGRQRDVAREPLKPGTLVKTGAAPGYQTCAWLVGRLQQLVAELNASRVRYAPNPAASAPRFDGANSNSFTFWAVSRLNLRPPPAPPGTYGYYANLTD